MRIAILCDSLLAGPKESVPSVYEAGRLLGGELEVVNFAMQWRTLRQNRPNVEAVINANPDVIIVGHGNSEALMARRPHHAGRYGDLPVESPFAARRRDLVHRALGRNRRPHVRFSRFEAELRQVVGELVQRTDALVLIQGPSGVEHDMQPVAVRGRARRYALIAALEARQPQRVRALWVHTVLRQWEDFRADHRHLNAEGQAAVGRLIANCVTHANVTS